MTFVNPEGSAGQAGIARPARVRCVGAERRNARAHVGWLRAYRLKSPPETIEDGKGQVGRLEGDQATGRRRPPRKAPPAAPGGCVPGSAAGAAWNFSAIPIRQQTPSLARGHQGPAASPKASAPAPRQAAATLSAEAFSRRNPAAIASPRPPARARWPSPARARLRPRAPGVPRSPRSKAGQSSCACRSSRAARAVGSSRTSCFGTPVFRAPTMASAFSTPEAMQMAVLVARRSSTSTPTTRS